MSLYEGVRTRVRVDSELPDELEVKVRMHHGSELTPFILAVMGDVVTELAGVRVLCDLLYAGDLVIMNEPIEGLRNKFFKWKRLLRARV